MGTEGAQMQGLWSGLRERSRRALAEDLPELASEAAQVIGGFDLIVYLVDHEQLALHPLPGSTAADGTEPLPLDSTLPGRVFRTVEPLHVDVDGGQRWWIPLVDGLERLGVLALTVSRVDDRILEYCGGLAYLISELLVTKSGFGDLIESVRRTRPMSLAAEMHRSLLPPLTVGSERATISGIFAPTYDVGGDAFDYALAPERAQLLLVDAMGHGLGAGLLASVAVAAYRAARRGRLSLPDTYRTIDEAISQQFDPDHFATGVLVELDLEMGRLAWINAGHPPPLLLRDGKVVKTLETPPALPFGLGDGLPEPSEEALQPDDLLVLVTDGVLEARSATGQFFGARRLTEFLQREAAARHPAPEALRRLNHAILAHHDGQLSDDATTVVLHWHGRRPTYLLALPKDPHETGGH